MRGRRLLPEAAYDFHVVDGRDGEREGPFGTLAAAKRVAKRWRDDLVRRQRPCIEIEWLVNERKVLRLLRPSRTKGVT